MKKINELGALIKKKNPEYLDLTDEKAGELVKKKFPGSYDDYFDDETFDNVIQLLDFYSPQKGRLTSWWQRGKGESRVKLLQVINEEQSLLLEKGAQIADAVLQGKQKMVAFEMFLAQHHFELFKMKAQAKLIEMALEEGYTVENYQAVKLEWDASQIRHSDITHTTSEAMRYENNQTGNQIRLQDNQFYWQEKLANSGTTNEIRLAEALSNIKIRETDAIEGQNLNREITKMQEEVRLAILAKSMTGYQKRMLVQELLDTIYQQIESIRYANLLDSTKLRMIQDREEIIIFFKGQAAQLLLNE